MSKPFFGGIPTLTIPMAKVISYEVKYSKDASQAVFSIKTVFEDGSSKKNEDGTWTNPPTAWFDLSMWVPEKNVDMWADLIKKGAIISVNGAQGKVESWKDKTTGEPRTKLAWNIPFGGLTVLYGPKKEKADEDNDYDSID